MAIVRLQPEMITPAASLPSLFASLLKITEALGSSLELHTVLQTILEQTTQEMQAQQGSILLFDEHQDRLQMLASIGLPEEMVRKGYIARRGSIAEYVIEHNQPLILNDQGGGNEYRPLDNTRRIVSSMCLPLRARGRVLGTINLNRLDPELGPFHDADLETMVLLTSHAAIFIENSRLHEANLRSERLAAIGQTVAGISHCIKNILTGVRGGLSLIDMATGSQNWEMLGKGRDILGRNVERISSIMLDMLDYSKERTPAKARLPLNSLIEEVFNTVRGEAAQREIALESQVDADAAFVDGDGQQLFRCLLNLVGNALDATPKGGRVWVTAETATAPAALNRLRGGDATAAAVIRVCDSGPGIAAENHTTIFEPFFSTKGSKGTGLGLAVTRKLIREHGGDIELESAPGESAIFAIYLPA